jgi:sRNA-binding protein
MQAEKGRNDGDRNREWQQTHRERDGSRPQYGGSAPSAQVAGEGADDMGMQMQMEFEVDMEMGAEAATLAKAEAGKTADDEAARKKRRLEKEKRAEKEKRRKAEKRKKEKDLRARSKAKKEAEEAKQPMPTAIEEPTHLASLLQEEPLELAAPEELFSKNTAGADAGAEETVGQGATALMLDAILMDSSVRVMSPAVELS